MVIPEAKRIPVSSSKSFHSIQREEKERIHMENLFNRYHWNPIREGYFPQSQLRPHSVKQKVINVPVQFIGTDDRNSKLLPVTPQATALVVPSEEARVSAASTIQRVARGFLVRKNARVVHQVSAEVDKIERNLKEEEAKIFVDARERLRVNEALMALLLRLDSVRGVRSFRKKVIRRIITLQEMIDSISTSADGTIGTIGIGEEREDSSNEAADEYAVDKERAEDRTLDPEEETNGAEMKLEREIPAAVESTNRKNDLIAAADGTISTSGIANDLKDSMSETADKSSIDHENQTLELEENEAVTDMLMKIQEVHQSPSRESHVIGFEIDGNVLCSSVAEEIPKGHDLVASQWPSSMSESLPGEKAQEGIGMRKLIENMTVENERLKEMVEQLCATSAEQCHLMEGLANRVENLERFVHRMDRRRKRRASACSAISSAK